MLSGFRTNFYDRLTVRDDALFELTDAVAVHRRTEGQVRSPVAGRPRTSHWRRSTTTDTAPSTRGSTAAVHTVDAQGPLWRWYMITGASPGELSVSVKRLDRGRVSSQLHELRPGEKLLISGPYGTP
ncbi:FAD-binding oxidoreductase [Streptomyces sp. NPDC051217]|uniref:FAD-binding oxidoreductase n=1 Tax=Streptomyces sp. NPDC051217 TaxID=3365644 RepID=UPI0037AC34A4